MASMEENKRLEVVRVGESVLLTALGRGRGYQSRPYTIGNYEVRSRYAPAALLACLAGQESVPWPTRVIVLVTPEVQKDTLPGFEAELLELAACGWPSAPAIHAVAIDAPTEVNGLWQQFHGVTEVLDGVSDLVMDVTHGFRSLPLIYWAAAHYRRALDDGMTVHHVYYAALEAAPQDGPVPFVDLTPLVSLPEWSYAVRAWNHNGRLGPLRDLVQKSKAPQGRERSRSQLASRLNDVALFWDNGLPLDVEIKATGVVRRLRELKELLPDDPLASKLLRQTLLDTLTPWELSLPGDVVGEPKKADLVLDEEELRRELKMAERYLEMDALAFAVGIAREWIINYVLWSTGQASKWLNPGKRETVGNLLARGEALRAQYPHRLSSMAIAVVIQWEEVRQLRNGLAHHGFRDKGLDLDRRSVTRLLADFAGWLDREPFSLPSGGGRVLLTALGMNPGALYTVLQKIGPFDGVVVVSSAQTEGELATCRTRVPNAPPAARWQQQVVDPYVPDREGTDAACIAQLLVDADEVVVNLTGGTTVMQFTVMRVADIVRRWQVPVHTYAALDRRSPAEQRDNPWVVGELVQLQVEGPRKRRRLQP